LKLSHSGSDLPSSLARVEETVRKARRENPKIARQEIYFLTDLGRVGWLPESQNSAAWRQFQERSRRLAESAALVVIDLGQSGADNVAVTDVRCSEQLATTSATVTLETSLKNFGRQERSRVGVDLVVGGRQIRRQLVDLPAGGEVPLAFSYRFDAPGDHVAEVRVDEDRLQIDDHRWLALQVKRAIRVLCIDGHPSATPFEGAADYLAYALAPRGRESDRTVVYPHVVPESRLLEVDLDQYDCVFLANVAQFTPSEARVLENYLKAGGSLVFFLGDQVMASRYNRELAGADPKKPRLLPARLGDVVDSPQSQLDPRGFRHPIARAFRGHPKALNTRVEKYFQLLIPPRSKAEIVLALEGGEPLMVEEPIHRGRVVLFATSAEPSWTLMPKWPSFVPIIRETLSYLVADKMGYRNLTVGEPLGAALAPGAGDASLSIQRPDGRSETLAVRSRGDQSYWSYSDTLISGVYVVRSASSASRGEVFAVNVDTEESDLAKLSPEELREEVWPDIPFEHQTTWQDTEEDPITRITQPSSLSRWLLYAVLGLLLVETYLARLFGNPAV
jgi:hypothetical protein